MKKLFQISFNCRFYCLSLIFLFAGLTSINSQIAEQWFRNYNGPIGNNDVASAITTDGSGNVYVTGYCTTASSGYDYLTIKYDREGTLQWVRTYNGPGNNNDAAIAISIDGSGNIYVTGTSSGNGTDEDYATIKYNSSGVQQWVQRFNGPDNRFEEASAMAVDVSGNVYVTGSSLNAQPPSGTDYATVKYNSSGNQIWAVRFNSNQGNDDWAHAITIDASGNVYVTGGGQLSLDLISAMNCVTVKYNSSGVQQWIATYNGPPGNENDEGYGIAINSTGDVYVTANSTGIISAIDYATIKYNSSGIQQWVQRYNGPGNANDMPIAVKLDSAGNVYVTGTSAGNGTDYDFATIKYNPAGVQQWLNRYNTAPSGYESASGMVIDRTGIYITGVSFFSVTTRKDFATVKYGLDGSVKWAINFNGSANADDIAYGISVQGGDVFVAGSSIGINSANNFTTVRYSELIGIKTLSNEIPSDFNLSQNYPNPFNPSTAIKFDIPKSSHVQIAVYDILGREVQQLLNEEKKPGSYEITWDGSGFASGVYFYRIIIRQAGSSTDEFVETKKMLMLK